MLQVHNEGKAVVSRRHAREVRGRRRPPARARPVGDDAARGPLRWHAVRSRAPTDSSSSRLLRRRSGAADDAARRPRARCSSRRPSVDSRVTDRLFPRRVPRSHRGGRRARVAGARARRPRPGHGSRRSTTCVTRLDARRRPGADGTLEIVLDAEQEDALARRAQRRPPRARRPRSTSTTTTAGLRRARPRRPSTTSDLLELADRAGVGARRAEARRLRPDRPDRPDRAHD